MYVEAEQVDRRVERTGRTRRRRRHHLLRFLLLVVAVVLCCRAYSFPELFGRDDWGWNGPAVITGAARADEPAAVASPCPTTGGDTVSGETIAALEERAREDHRYETLAEHPEDYPEGLLRQVLRNAEVLDFALAYPENVWKNWDPEDISLELPSGMPHYLQWDGRWGYGAYGSSTVGVSGCGPTCLSMAVVGLTGNTGANPLAVAQYSASQGWYVPGAGTDWELLRSGAEHYGLSWQELSPEPEHLYRILDAGGCVIASMLPGDFTASGHFILISAYTPEGFQVLDPNSESLSRVWDFYALKSQFASLWGYLPG